MFSSGGVPDVKCPGRADDDRCAKPARADQSIPRARVKPVAGAGAGAGRWRGLTARYRISKLPSSVPPLTDIARRCHREAMNTSRGGWKERARSGVIRGEVQMTAM